MKKTKITYWIFTGILSALTLLGAIPDLLSTPEALTVFKHLGYPAYLSPFLGLAKILGVVAILVPRFPRLKEWAYAGLFFDFTGAMYSGMAVGDPMPQWAAISVAYILLFGSYVFYHRLAAAKENAALTYVR
ncbi:DoxX family protein [Chitinophaga eiseniae]|uniref:DoxX family protein n=1 Tax=Chitinophaga eiseniae TaxID=634771 RepID=A0A847SSK0_9BACT|nr:DoxX family protein [Chitinophaga eiseniae]NLR80556.1 DoxX family protein [Chitinophaga eiseniae]